MAEFFDLRGMDVGEKEVGGESMNRADAIPFSLSASEAGPYKPRFADHGQQPPCVQPVNTNTPLLPPAVLTRTRKRTQPYRRRIDYTNPNIAKPIDWSKAKFSFSRLNLDTLATDILASTGHPLADRYLNQHLEPLLQVYKVNENSDLASIRWDLVDPDVRSLIAQSAPEGVTMPPGDEEQNHHAQNVTAYLPTKPTRGGMTPGGFGSTGRTSGSLSGMNAAPNYTDTSGYFKRSFEPTPRNLQSPFSRSFEASRQQYDPRPQQYDPRPQQRPTMSDGLGPAQSWGLQPWGWESSYQSPYNSAPSADFGLDGTSMNLLHGHPSPPQEASTPVQPQEFSVPTVLTPVTPVTVYGQNDITRIDSRSLVENGSGSDALSSSRLQPSLNPRPSSAPRRGRLPQSSNFFIEITSATPQKRGRPPKNTEQNPPVHASSKKRGRPFKTTESAARAATATSDSTDGISKKRGRPFKLRAQLEIPVPEPEYIPFICEWKGCPAELQNLETLEVHVFNVHSKKQPSGNRFCLWGKCGEKHETDKAVDSQLHDESNEFRSKAEWKDHVNQQHLIPFAWHMGDGPKGTSLSIKPKSEIAPWLIDNNGRHVTPSVKDQLIEEGRAKDNNAKRFNRKVEGIYWVYERIESPKAHMKAQGLRTGNTSDGDDEDDIQMGVSP